MAFTDISNPYSPSSKHLRLIADMQNSNNYRKEMHAILTAPFEFLKLIGPVVERGFTLILESFKVLIKSADILKLGDSFMPLISFIVVVGIIISFILYGVSINNNQKNPKNISSPKKSNIFNPMTMINQLFPIPTYKMKLFSYNFAPYSANADTSISNRPIITSGRCDNLNKLEVVDKNEGGLCFKTTTPEPIIWTLDIEKMPELNEVNTKLKAKIDENGQKYIVTIPWATYTQGGFYYYPDCKKATFEDGSSASYLFTDNGKHSCEKKVVPRNIYSAKNKEDVFGKQNDDYIS